MVRIGSAWLSLTPEPERELPDAVAILRHGSAAPPERLAAERDRVERLIVEARSLATAGVRHPDPELRVAAETTIAVIDNHEALRSGLMRRGRGGRGGRGR